jgi:methanogenic corrinoid protein MtbC1
LEEVIRPALVEIGERWHRGELPVATEHFATQFCLRHLNSMLSAIGAPSRPGLIVAACAPGELHEIGLLMLVVMLRWRGWEVMYLGPNLQLARLDEAIGPQHPRLLLFTATRVEAVQALMDLPAILQRFPQPPPRVAIGGQAVRHSLARPHADFVFIDDASPSEMVKTVEALMSENLDRVVLN